MILSIWYDGLIIIFLCIIKDAFYESKTGRDVIVMTFLTFEIGFLLLIVLRNVFICIRKLF